MIPPSTLMNQTLDRLKEIFIWNTYLTKLYDRKYFENAEEFLNEVIQVYGPYIEKILPPMLWEENWEAVSQKYNIHPIVKEAVAEIIFNGDSRKKPYFHQGYAVETLAISNQERKDTIITAPTATGKTECFLIPILDYCVKAKISDRDNSLKAIIIYPMKTLEADQLNRIVKYLNQINIRLKTRGIPSITVGIWDGDTPNSPVGEIEEDVGIGAKIVDGQSVRGLECPIHKNKLIWNRRSLVCEEGCSFPWIFVTRKDMRDNSVDILITNPEALEFALLSPHNKGFLIVPPEQSKVKYIVFDEAHVWSGASAASLSLLIQRLRHLYKSSKPTFILSSATITNPKEYASRLLLVGENEVNHVDFRGRIRQPEASAPVKYDIRPCKFNVILGTLFAAKNYSKSVDTILELLEANGVGSDRNERLNALRTCERLGLIQITDNCAELTTEGRNFFDIIVKYSLDSFSDVKASELLDNSEFLERWASLIEEKIPEVIDLLTVFGDRSFVHEKTLIDHVRERAGNNAGKAAEIVATLLNWGRAGNFLLDKYHYFIKPIEHVYWCPIDKILSHRKICPKCGKEIVELRFCRRCHEPFVFSEEKLKPIRKDLFDDEEPKICQCGHRLDAEIMGVGSTSYQTFITFLLSALGRNAYHRKVLIFSDSRGEAEAITTFTRSLDYSLILHIETCKILLENSPKDGMQVKRLHDKLKDKAIEVYFKGTPFDIEDEDLKPMKSQYFKFLYTLSTIYGPKSNKTRHNRLFSSSIISFKNIQDIFSLPLEISIAHYILVEVGYEDLVPVESIKTKVRKYFHRLYKLDKKGYQSIIQKILDKLVENGLLERVKNDMGKDCVKLSDAWEYKLNFFIPFQVSYCENCYIGYPSILNECPNCGSRQFLNKGRRFEIMEKAEGFDYSGGCFENLRKEVPYKLDHWANEILCQAIKNIKKNADAIFIANHRSGLPAIMRSRLEEGFRALSPNVNVICCTPTMELGIDIGSLNCACMIGIPPTKTNYIQRTGRTGRTVSLPSLLITIIRNEHAVDNHYLNKIEEYLNRKSELLKIPQFTETIIKQHLVSLTLHFLNCVSPKYKTDYYDIFPVQNRFQFAGKKNIIFLQKILSRKLLMFFEDILDHYDGIENFVLENIKEALFTIEESKIDVSRIKTLLQELFLGSSGNPPEVIESILNVVKSYVEVYKSMEDKGIDTGELLQNFLDNFSCLSLCLSKPRLLADYRGIMRSIPVVFAGKRFKDVIIELKELGHAIREAFPGFIKADGMMARGALLRQQGIEYEVVDVKTIDKVIQVVKMCPNKKCTLAFHPFDISAKICPLCKSELTEIKIFPIFGAIAKSKGRQNIVNTTPITSTLVPLYKEVDRDE